MSATAQRHEHVIHTMSQDLRQANEKIALEEVSKTSSGDQDGQKDKGTYGVSWAGCHSKYSRDHSIVRTLNIKH